MHRYKAWNGAMATTAALAPVTTGTAIRTMLQIATPATRALTIISWGFSVSAAQAGNVELIQTDVAATVTAHVAAGIQPLDASFPASLVTLGTAATGFTATAEGATTASRTFDQRQIPGVTDQLTWAYQFMYDERPVVPISKFLRVRATFGTAPNMLCWVCWDE